MCYYNSVKISGAEFIQLRGIEKELKEFQLSKPMGSGFDYPNWPIIRPLAGCNDWEVVFVH